MMTRDEGDAARGDDPRTQAGRAVASKPRPSAREPRAEARAGRAGPGETRAPRAGGAHDPPREGEGAERRKGVSDGLRKAIASGIRTVISADELVRDGLPREVIGYVMRQTDAAKDEIVRIVGVQLGKFLENIDIAGELQKILTAVSFEIKTEIRFIPNDHAVVVPRARVRVSRGRKAKAKDGGEGVAASEHDKAPAKPEPAAKRSRRTRLGSAVDLALGVFQRDMEAVVIKNERNGESSAAPRRHGDPEPNPDNGTA